jgi:hypothetical protein
MQNHTSCWGIIIPHSGYSVFGLYTDLGIICLVGNDQDLGIICLVGKWLVGNDHDS